MLAGTGCADDSGSEFVGEPASDCFNLTINVPLKATSRATRATPVELNEFKVRSLHFYFYKYDGENKPVGPSDYDCVVNQEFDTQSTLRVALPSDALLDGGLFGTSGTECFVYSVANVDEEKFPEGTAKTIDELKATPIGSTFDQTSVQDAFAMDGEAVVTLTDRTKRLASGEIELTRAAAKLTLSVEIPTSITVTGTVVNADGTTSEGETREYQSHTDQMRVWITNGVKQSLLNTSPFEVAEADLYSNEIKAAEGFGSAFTFDDTMKQYKYVQNVPFYSYPNQWDPTNPNGNTYLTLLVPWSYTEKGERRQIATYYRLAVQPEKCVLERNMHYDMRVTISRLGGTTVQEPIDKTVEWNYAIPWNTQTLETDIKEIRYLLLNNNYYDSAIETYKFEMNNETDISVTFGSSHAVEIESVTMSWRDYYNNVDRSISLTTNGTYRYSNLNNYNASTHFAGIEVDNTASTLTLKREMRHISWNNGATITSNAAFCMYTFDIKLRHINDPSQTATVRITQIPAIYITADKTPKGTRFINDNNYTYNHGSYRNPIYRGFHYNDKYGASNFSGTQQKLYIGSIHDVGSDGASNPYTYVITISKFGAGELKKYIVADPRTREVDNLPVSDDKTASAAWSMLGKDILGGADRQLKNYYPADNNSDKERFIAPKIRVASQWGVTFPVIKEGAQRRCASYQENGRPAGRWRLPTAAEIEFIATLSCNKYIPYLFGSASQNANYWCASGAASVTNSGNNPNVTITNETSQRSVRCVYDEWYWGDDVLSDKTKFSWGDRLRSTSGN